ncbi:MAG: 3-hydroxyacyl-CoA dehydrogenase NAD-binding domain-containing protein [Rhodomicrobium sp.]
MTQDERPANPVRLARSGSVAVIEIDNPPVNAASQAVREGLLGALSDAAADPGIAAIVLMGAGKTFVAGADIREFDGPLLGPNLPDVCNAIEDCSKPVVAALHGTALGGGCEVALAAHARIMAEGSVLGLPEVKLGLIPGAGGTQRVPRLADAVAAFEIASSGRLVQAKEAAQLGIVDRIVPLAALREEAVQLAAELHGQPMRRTRTLPIRLSDASAFEAAKTKALARARGQAAPAALAVAMTAALTHNFAEGCDLERQLFLELRGSDQAKAMRHVFFAERQAGRLPELRGVSQRPVSSVGIVGAGTMGAGIAGACLAAGFDAVLAEPDEAARERGGNRIAVILEKAKSRQSAAAQPGALRIEDALGELTGCQLIIEAVFEDMAVKADVLAQLGRIAVAGTVIATNTSYLDVNRLAEASGRPQDIIGLHFFAPAEIMRLVEVVRGGKSAPDAVATGLAIARRLGKLPVVAGVCDGFVGNRIMSAYRGEMEYALEDGALPWEVDAALEAYGFAMGPFAVSDLSGLDIAWARRKRLASTRAPAQRYFAAAGRLCELGRFGRKTGSGWYRYDGSKRQPDPAVEAVIIQERQRKGISPRPVPAAEIQSRARAAIVNEAARILEEGIAASPSDIDLVLVHGYGYPVWRGGPMFDADSVGPAAILKDVERMCATNGAGFEPAPLLRDLAARGITFAAWANSGNQIPA